MLPRNPIQPVQVGGEKKYYGQTIQDDDIHKEFVELHKKLVNEVIAFCKKHGLSAYEFWLHADGLEDSIKAGSWQPCTDSGFEIYPFSTMPRDEVEPLMFSM